MSESLSAARRRVTLEAAREIYPGGEGAWRNTLVTLEVALDAYAALVVEAKLAEVREQVEALDGANGIGRHEAISRVLALLPRGEGR